MGLPAAGLHAGQPFADLVELTAVLDLRQALRANELLLGSNAQGFLTVSSSGAADTLRTATGGGGIHRIQLLVWRSESGHVLTLLAPAIRPKDCSSDKYPVPLYQKALKLKSRVRASL